MRRLSWAALCHSYTRGFALGFQGYSGADAPGTLPNRSNLQNCRFVALFDVHAPEMFLDHRASRCVFTTSIARPKDSMRRPRLAAQTASPAGRALVVTHKSELILEKMFTFA